MALRSIEEELDQIARDYRLPRVLDPSLESTFQPVPENRSLGNTGREEGRGESKAIAGAMRALQDKIKHLEITTSRLKLDLEEAETRSKSNQNSLLAHTQACKSQESTLLLQVQNLEEALIRERTARRDREQALNDLSNSTKTENDDLRDQIKSLTKQVEQKGREIQLFERNLDAIEKERTRFLLENSDLKGKNARLSAEIEALREGSDQSRLKLVETVTGNEDLLRKQLRESEAKVRDLEAAVGGLRAELAQKDSLESERVTSQRKSPRKSQKKGKERVSARISILEKDLSSRTEAYKRLLQQADTMDLSLLRTSLNSLSEEIDVKSKELARAKRCNQA